MEAINSNKGKNGPGKQIHAQVDFAELQKRVSLDQLGILAEQEHEAERNPERSVPGKRAETEIVVLLELHETRNQLCPTAKTEPQPDHGARPQ